MKDIDFDSIEEMADYILKDIKDTMKAEVLESVRDIETDIIQMNVYDVYEPKTYERRLEQDGLLDRDNIHINNIEVSSDTLDISFTNDTKVSNYTYDSKEGDYLDDIIENGISPYSTEYSKPRPFIKPTFEILQSKEIIENILKKKLDYVD